MKKIFVLNVVILMFSVGMAHALTLSNIQASWNDPTGPGLSTVSYNGDHSQILWGGNMGSGKSYLLFTETGTPYTFDFNQAISLGTLTHYNAQNTSGTALTSADLALELAFSDPAGLLSSYEFDFTINNTPNYGTLTNPGNNDLIYFENEFASNSYLIGGEWYTLQLIGFGSSATNLVSQFSSMETGTNSTQLWARMTVAPNTAPVPEPTTILLLGSGLLGLAGFRKKNQQ